jgi:hypothetical protein
MPQRPESSPAPEVVADRSRPEPVPGTATRTEVIARALIWLTADNGHPTPYSRAAVWTDGYRQDCSGYVAMALRLAGPGPNTVALVAHHSTPIHLDDLEQGDLIIKADSHDPRQRHVVIFDRWVDRDHTSYWSYEQAYGVGTRRHQHNYGLVDGDGFGAYRPHKLV